MNKLLRASALFTIALASVALTYGADNKSTAPTPAVTELAGEFQGQWRARNDSGGDLRITFSQVKDAAPTAEAMFTFEGANVPTKTKSLTIDGKKFELVFAWEIQGVASSTKLTGELKGDVLEGNYESQTAERAATGTWTIKRVKSSS